MSKAIGLALRALVMREGSVLVCPLAVGVGSSWAQNSPLPGKWETSTTLKGAPDGQKNSVGQGCISAQLIEAGFEQAILDISTANKGSDKGPDRCVIKDLQKGISQSQWQSVCDGPRGQMPGTGRATKSDEAAEINQSFKLKMGPMSLDLEQNIKARRLGAC